VSRICWKQYKTHNFLVELCNVRNPACRLLKYNNRLCVLDRNNKCIGKKKNAVLFACFKTGILLIYFLFSFYFNFILCLHNGLISSKMFGLSCRSQMTWFLLKDGQSFLGRFLLRFIHLRTACWISQMMPVTIGQNTGKKCGMYIAASCSGGK